MQQCPKRRRFAIRNLWHAITADQLRADHADLRIGFGERRESGKRLRRNNGVVIQEEKVLAASDGRRLIVRPTEAEVGRIAE